MQINMDLSGLKEKINAILESIRKIPEKVSGVFGQIKELTKDLKRGQEKEREQEQEIEGLKRPSFIAALVSSVNDFLDHHVGPDKRKPLLIGSGALIGAFLILLIAAGISGSKKKRVIASESAPEGITIAADELFIPAEPDFVPEFIFEREKRRSWSLEDIRQYWRIPDASDRWVEEIKSAVDKLMEGIP